VVGSCKETLMALIASYCSQPEDDIALSISRCLSNDLSNIASIASVIVNYEDGKTPWYKSVNIISKENLKDKKFMNKFFKL